MTYGQHSLLTAQVECLRAEVQQLRALLTECAPHVLASAEALHLLDGFQPQPRALDGLAARVRTAVKNTEEHPT